MTCFSPVRLLAAGLILAAAFAGATQAKAEAQLLIEADTGKVLHAENATYPWYPASVTKLMTAYTTLRAVKERRVNFDTLLTVSRNAVAQQPTKMGFKLGTQVTVDNALKMLMVKSANDMAVTLAEGVGGSIEKFADLMNSNAQRLGMTQTNYVNPNGLPAENQITSARDLAILARALIREFPEYDFYWHISAIKLGKKVMHNYNSLIDRYPGADGMKTGFICASGYNLVASATRNGKRLIAVILGAYGGGVRAQKAAQLLESGFNGNNLSWLKPSLGNVENLVPINAAPPNLRDEMCGKHRRKPPSEENSEEEEASSGGNGTETGDNSDSQQNFSMSSLKYQPGKFVLGPSIPAAPPIEVFIGPAKGAGADAKPAKQIKAGLTPPKTSPWKTPDSASDPKADNSAADQADEKPAKPVKHAKPKAKSAAKTAAKKKPEQ